MDGSTVSPSPASLTEGHDLCETDATNMVIHIVTLLICICGLPGNGAVLCFISLKDTMNFFALAFADFLFLLFALPSALLFLLENMSCSTLMPPVYLRFLFQLSLVSYYWGLFHLIDINIMDLLLILDMRCCRCHLSERLMHMVHNAQNWAFFTLFTVIPMVASLCPSHQQEQCRTALISIYAIFLLLFATPMLISRTILFIKAKCGSQQQQPKRRDIVLFLIVLLTLLLCLCNFLQQLSYNVVSSQMFFLLTCINSSIKPFIYFTVGSSWRPCSVGSPRLSLQRVFDNKKKNKPSRNKAATAMVIGA